MYKFISFTKYNAADLIRRDRCRGAFVNPRSAIAAGTSLDVAKGLCNYIESAREEEMHHWVSEKLFSLMYEHRSHMKMTADLPKVLQALKDKGFILGVVTADDFAPTELFLKQYKLENFLIIL